MTILIISLIFVMTMRFNTSVRSSITSASNLQDNVALDSMARSVFSAVRAILSADAEESGFDSLHEDWANMAVASGYLSMFFERGRGSISVRDHSGRLQVNSLLKKEGDSWVVNEEQKKVWENLLVAEEFELGEEEAAGIVEALIDWIDDNDEPLGFGGAESSYYQGLEKPYEPRNGPMEFVEELLLVRGITPELYNGTTDYPGLKTLVTPHGRDGRININTADPFILGALAEEIEPDMVDDLLAYRDNEDNDLADPEWYTWAPGFPGDITIPPDLITTTSVYFEVFTVVVRGNMAKKVRSMVARGPGVRTQLVYWKVE